MKDRNLTQTTTYYEYVSFGWYQKNNKWKLGIIPNELVKQIKTPQRIIDELSTNLFESQK